MTNREILEIAMAQSAIDLCAKTEDFEKFSVFFICVPFYDEVIKVSGLLFFFAYFIV